MVNRVRVELSGFAGAPGVATFYSTDVTSLRAALVDLWGGLGPIMPNTFTAQIESVGDVINSATGAIEGTWTGDVLSASGSGGGPDYAGPVGATISWLTADVADGSRIRGRTFVVPLPTSAYDGSGTLLESTRTVIQTVATAFVAAAAPGFVIWHRPRLARPASGRLKFLPAHDGSLHIVNGTIVPDRAQVLRSRRQ